MSADPFRGAARRTDASARILLVEDNVDLAAGIRYNLEREGYDVVCAENGSDALDLARSALPDLVILDLMLPGMDGFAVLQEMRREGLAMPVLVLTARGEEVDKVRAFRLDADQYVTKPFGLLELLERIRMMLRRRGSSAAGGATSARAAAGDPAGGPPPGRAAPVGEAGEMPRRAAGGAGERIRFGDIEIDVAGHRVSRRGAPVALSPKSFELLLALVRREGQALARHELLREVWGHLGRVQTRTVDWHISELRGKLEDDPENPRHIHTVWKVGYRFER